MKINPSTEFLLIGILMTGPKHGYDILQFLNASLEPTWHLSPSQLYSVLKRLENKANLKSIVKAQDRRPSRRVFTVTAEGRRRFYEWLNSPVEHGREFRIEFFGKLFFLNHLEIKGAAKLIEAQICVFKMLKRKMRERKKTEQHDFNKLILEFKINTLDNRIKWLSKTAIPFFRDDLSNKAE